MEASDGMMVRVVPPCSTVAAVQGRQHIHELIERGPIVQDAAEGEVEAVTSG